MISRYSIISLLLAAFVATCSGQKFSLGTCPTLQSTILPAPLPLAQLIGTWREYARSKSPYAHSWRCPTYTIAVITANARYTVSIGARKKITNSPLRIAGTINVVAPNGANTAAGTYLTFTLTDGLTTKRLDYYILGYDVAATPTTLVLYACSNVGAFGKIENALLLTKTNVPDASVIAALQILSQNGFPAASLAFTYQSDCLL